MKDTKHFKAKEFLCRCCGEEKMVQSFVDMLELARDAAGIPFKVVSGYRCLNHNRKIGSKDTSAHIKGLAADIRANTLSDRFIIIKACMEAGFCRFGIAQTYIHVDLDGSKPKSCIWLY